ncbi:MAG: endo-polygalacturonase [Planctomycetes bacterium]|nr:endo-polygalacturonase [Planctomycetota bacterium]
MKTIVTTQYEPRKKVTNHIRMLIGLGIMIASFIIFAGPSRGAATRAAKIVTYPVPAGEVSSSDYQVQVAGRKIDTYMARVLDPPFAGKKWDHGGQYWFANFDMSGTVVVRIESKRSLRNVVIRPQSYGIKPTLVNDHTLTLTLDRPLKFSIEPDGKKGPLLLFANPIETNAPKTGDKNVVYFGPGVHKPEKIILESNQILYLAGGAVVKAEVLVKGTNIRICGRGILDGSDWKWRTGPVGNLIAIRNSTDVEINGITLRGSSHWTIVSKNSKRITVRNVKLCNSRVQNDDGINPCNSQDVLITDCFIRSDDDCIALKGLDFSADNSNVERITVENSTLWCDRARIFLLGHESRAAYMRNITIRNLDIIHFTMTPFLLEPGEDMRLEDITIEDIRMHGEGQREFIRLRPVVNQYMRKKVPGFISNILFKNITLEGQPGEYLVQIQGADTEHNVRNITFENVSIAGTKLNKESKRMRIGKHTKNVMLLSN